MSDRQAKPSNAPRKGERTKTRTDHADDHHPKGTPNGDRHASETAGGLLKHHQPHTTGHPARRERSGD
jgi:hypothetical protein